MCCEMYNVRCGVMWNFLLPKKCFKSVKKFFIPSKDNVKNACEFSGEKGQEN